MSVIWTSTPLSPHPRMAEWCFDTRVLECADPIFTFRLNKLEVVDCFQLKPGTLRFFFHICLHRKCWLCLLTNPPLFSGSCRLLSAQIRYIVIFFPHICLRRKCWLCLFSKSAPAQWSPVILIILLTVPHLGFYLGRGTSLHAGPPRAPSGFSSGSDSGYDIRFWPALLP